MKKEARKCKCPYCGYTWIPRVERPKECPLCKRYIICKITTTEAKEK